MAVERGNYLTRHISDTEFHGLPLAQQEFRKLWHKLQGVLDWDSGLDIAHRETMRDVLLAISKREIAFGDPIETNGEEGSPCTLFVCPRYQTSRGLFRVKVELFPQVANYGIYNQYPQIRMTVNEIRITVNDNEAQMANARMAIIAKPRSRPHHGVVAAFFISQNPGEDLFATKNRRSSSYSFKTQREFEAVIGAFKNYLCSSGNSAKIREALTLAG